MLVGLAAKLLAFVAREAIPFILSVVVRSQMRKVEKKLDDSLRETEATPK